MFLIRKNLEESYKLYLSKFEVFLGVTSLIFFITVLFDNLSDQILNVSVILGIVVGIIFGIIGIILEIGYLKYFMKMISGGSPSLEDLLKYTNIFWRYILGNILLILVVTIGLVFLIVPGIYLGLRFMFSPLFIIDKEMTIRGAFRKSSDITAGVKWKLLGLAVILGAIQFVGASLAFAGASPVLYGAGIVLISPFVVISYIKAYRSLQGLDS